jgi:hypothetical protein
MRYSTRRLLIALVTLIIGVLAAATWSARLGRRIWSPRVFAWRNFLRHPPKIEYQHGCPLLIANPRYYSLASFGSAIGGVLRFDVENRSDKLVHSYDCRYYSPVPYGNGAYGSQPDGGLPSGQSREDSISAHEYFELTLTIDFVQFADGTTWFSNAPEATVKPEGVSTGAKAAATHLLRVLGRDGPEAVMEALPRIHADVRGPFGTSADPNFGSFGFYSGVTNMVVRVQHAYDEGGLEKVEAVLRFSAG